MKIRSILLFALLVVFLIVFACDELTLQPKPRWNPEDPNYEAETDPANTESEPPVEPSNFTATPLSTSSIRLKWKDNSNFESGYELNRKLGENGDWVDVQAGLGKDASEYTDTDLAQATLYSYELTAINDAGVSPVKTVSATTLGEVVAPTVVSVSPAVDEVGVAVTSNITITFSEEMDANTITTSTITVSVDSVDVAGQVSYNNAAKTATFNPDADLELITTYTVTVTTGVTNSAGTALESDYTWVFTTETSGTTANWDEVNWDEFGWE